MGELKLYIKQTLENLSFSNMKMISINQYKLWKRYNFKKCDSLKIGLPWINFTAIDHLKRTLNKEMKVFEFGSGGSTIFLSDRVKEVFSVEHDKLWFQRVKSKIKDLGLNNWHGQLIEAEPSGTPIEPHDPSDPLCYVSAAEEYVNHSFKKYTDSILEFEDQYFDMVLIDGRARPSCILNSIKKVKVGGLLIVDNSDRSYYLKNTQKLLTSYKKVFHSISPGPYNRYFWGTTIFKKIE